VKEKNKKKNCCITDGIDIHRLFMMLLLCSYVFNYVPYHEDVWGMEVELHTF
jgi:hypothetical protein